MQFVVALELIGTVVMPASFIFLVVLIIQVISEIISPSGKPTASLYFGLAFFAGTLFAQAFLVFFTKRKVSYLGWMLIYASV